MNVQSNPVVVFDFDHTLTTFDTGTAFFTWLLKRAPWRVIPLLVAMPLVAVFAAVRSTRKTAARVCVWLATLSLSVQTVDALCERFVDERIAGNEPVFRGAGLDRVRFHVARGDTVIVATGTLTTLATALLARAGLSDVTVVGSSVKTFLFGIVADEHCYGPRKVQLIERRGFAPPWAVAYTDHRSDFALLENSRDRFLVNPKAKTVAAYEQRFGVKPNVLNWN